VDDQALIAKLLARLDEVETRLSHVEAYRAKLVREVKSLREENTILKEKVRDLTARINQDSSNSSKPPSSDKPWKDRRPSKPTGKSRGAQPGHVGKTLNLHVDIPTGS
jgi:transposase